MATLNDRVCPLNNRSCRCDPKATDKKLHPCALANRMGKLIRMFGSNFKDEAISAATRLRQVAQSEGISFNDLATLVENCDGQIEEKKYSDADAKIIFARGQEKGRAEEARKQQAPPEFYDADGHPRWNEIALFCQKNLGRLRGEWERTFINDMAGKTVWCTPTEKQAKHLLAIFVRLGGYYDPQNRTLTSLTSPACRRHCSISPDKNAG
jgi:hypothetical protein